MKTAKEWFQCLRPDLKKEAIRLTKSADKAFLNDTSLLINTLERKCYSMSAAIFFSIWWMYYDNHKWTAILKEALDIEQGRKPDIKPKKHGKRKGKN